MEEIMRTAFFVDSRIYKHYRLLGWFPKYLKQYQAFMIMMMDNSEGSHSHSGNEELANDAENNIFPDYVNYYIAI